MTGAIVREPDVPFEPTDPMARLLPPPSVPQPTTVRRLKDLQDAGLAGRVDAPEVPLPTVAAGPSRRPTGPATATIVEVPEGTAVVIVEGDDGTAAR